MALSVRKQKKKKKKKEQEDMNLRGADLQEVRRCSEDEN